MIPYTTGKMRTFLATATAGLALAGCESANDKKAVETSESKISAAVIPETQAECLKLKSATQEEIMVCMRSVTERDKLKMESEIATKSQILETEKATGKELDTTTEVLSKLANIAEAETAEAEVDLDDDFDDLFAAESDEIQAEIAEINDQIAADKAEIAEIDDQIAADKAEIAASLKRSAELLANKAK